MELNPDQWVTFYRFYASRRRTFVLVQKRDGETRTVTEQELRREQEEARKKPLERG